MFMSGAGVLMIVLGLCRSLAGRSNERRSSLAVALFGLTILLAHQLDTESARLPLLTLGLLPFTWLVLLLGAIERPLAWLSNNGEEAAGHAGDLPLEIDDTVDWREEQTLVAEELAAQRQAEACLADRAAFGEQ